ncbi:aspartate aminotransferase family protein [Mycolicibacterium smegmatis]|uniref:aspartate aminotransferase family protein n=1 Tax=Mycolicibacterium smegmatis TaxID=1772 RepID=UPI0005D99382|nr:aspartate aminotransferase family protein [Mycolicibacterium smegmatis]MDF1900724.1 aspartate aminotransferase family protein [Mycolicibacterium smegmatis]MDF1907003.1 aspartate aminotransferase family protein [Mycolicibacterium smegmatis]MDF1919198.1 aspartate aminotransferase family protein [Mycolicibacterium smegmatis]MDF1925265.1 aspartate aminotransferase family protein [Mycolicibacterium smegmatis]UAK52944.1 aspartate aminotransferase family protein [Mycolicibacterium smegmatis]
MSSSIVGSAAQDVSSDRVDRLIADEEQVFLRRQPRSAELIARAREHLAGGATSNWQIAQPQAVWLSHGHGSKVYDVDGTEYVDMHGGYGASIAGHAHPAIVDAVSQQIRRGTHFAQPTENAIWIAEELSRRFDLPLWRFANSGTEATMDAVHLARAVTGRDLIIKVEGCYHGHHDSVQVSVLPEPDEVGPREHPVGVPGNTGIPEAIRNLVVVVPFNDIEAVARALTEHRGQVAAMILEPVMMNAGIIPPAHGYLAGIRDLLHEAGSLLIYDEVKTGFTTGPGGVTASSGVVPDIVCLAKALGGGIAVAAIGGTTRVMSAIADGRYEQVGTFNGNPLAMAATRATLSEVLTDEAYAHLDSLAADLRERLTSVITEHGVDWHVVAVGAKGCVTFRKEPVREYRDFLQIDDRLGHLHWLMQHNGGVFLPPWGKVEQWLLSVQHDTADVDRFVANFARLAAAVAN